MKSKGNFTGKRIIFKTDGVGTFGHPWAKK